MRVVAYIDGFNLYHAVADLGEPHLKWLDLWRLCEQFSPSRRALHAVHYYSAFATWLKGPYERHRKYVKALEASGVRCEIAKFKPKPLECHACHRRWTHHEEKESDVRLAVGLVMGAVLDQYDRALLVTADSDLVPAVQVVHRNYPKKEMRILTPPGRTPSADLMMAAGGSHCGRRLARVHLSRCLLPELVTDSSGAVVCQRPADYAPPGSATP